MTNMMTKTIKELVEYYDGVAEPGHKIKGWKKKKKTLVDMIELAEAIRDLEQKITKPENVIDVPAPVATIQEATVAALRGRLTNAQVLDRVREVFPDGSSLKCVAWYRSKLRREGENIPTNRELTGKVAG